MSKRSFSAAAIAEAEYFANQAQIWDRPQVQGFTIDDCTSLDLDDAIWIEQTDQGATLSVHIADVAEAIPPGSELDKDAISRCHTRYFKQGQSHMLPRILSEVALSLHEQQARPTLTIQLELTTTGEVTDVTVFESWLISSKRFSYTNADDAITRKSSQWHGTLALCQRWAAVLNRKRKDSGAIGGMFAKHGIYFNENGQLSQNPDVKYHSHRIIEEFMIAANAAVAKWLADDDHPALFRNHVSKKKLAAGQDKILQALLALGNPEAIQQRLQKWLKRAEYGPVVMGHLALNLDAYGHFTSPIRRLPDLINHRMIKARLRGVDPPYTLIDLANLSTYINQRVRDEDKRRKRYYIAEAHRALQAQIETIDEFQQLPQKEFSRLIKHANGKIPTSIEQEIQDRLAQGRLMVQDYYKLVVEGKDRALQRQALQTLEAHPQKAAGVIAMGISRKTGWTKIRYIEHKQDELFSVWVIVNIKGEPKTTIEPGQAPRRHAARHQACWYWLNQWVDQALVDSQHPHTQTLPAQLLDGQNHVGTLNHHCQVMDLQPATFDYTQTPQGYQCSCQLFTPDYIEGIGKARKKRLAKQRAAMQVLEVLKAEQYR